MPSLLALYTLALAGLLVCLVYSIGPASLDSCY